MGEMALFVLIVVGLVVAQTWLDWCDSRKGRVVPDWLRGAALGGVIAISLAAATSLASSWLLSESGGSHAGLGSHLLWLEAGFLVCTMGIIVLAVRQKRFRFVLFFAGVLLVAVWLGITLSL